MNGPRTKDKTELAWNTIKRVITAKVNFEAQVWRERELNRRIDDAWKVFKDDLANERLQLADVSDLNELGGGPRTIADTLPPEGKRFMTSSTEEPA